MDELLTKREKQEMIQDTNNNPQIADWPTRDPGWEYNSFEGYRDLTTGREAIFETMRQNSKRPGT